ncbi:hypothetical protein DMJ13_21315 [halophilic archaeon]|nr:hypothetical protein DMJ13_21315 [halophilic archaeon]
MQGRITHIESEDGIARVTVDVGADTSLRTLITQTSLDTLGLTEGETVIASFKATVTRAVPEPDTHNDYQGSVS